VSASPEYYLVRLTAQSKGSDPKVISGGRPELTSQDIQTLVALVRDRLDYLALTAKYCQSELAETQLLETTKADSIRIWHGTPSNWNTPIKTVELFRMAEAAMIVFLTPRDPQGRERTDTWISEYLGVHRNTYAKKNRAHCLKLLSRLSTFESSGLRAISDALSAKSG